jgi:hypothetical protein
MRLPLMTKVGIFRSLLTLKLWTDRRSQWQFAREGELYMPTSIGLIRIKLVNLDINYELIEVELG